MQASSYKRNWALLSQQDTWAVRCAVKILVIAILQKTWQFLICRQS